MKLDLLMRHSLKTRLTVTTLAAFLLGRPMRYIDGWADHNALGCGA
jgi:hypothetical protein